MRVLISGRRLGEQPHYGAHRVRCSFVFVVFVVFVFVVFVVFFFVLVFGFNFVVSFASLMVSALASYGVLGHVCGVGVSGMATHHVVRWKFNANVPSDEDSCSGVNVAVVS